jgi:hypothetical protein
MWSTSEFVNPTKANSITPEGFMAAWVERTALYMFYIDLPPKTWKKIMAATIKFVEVKKGVFSRPIVQAAKIPLRCRIVDADESN